MRKALVWTLLPALLLVSLLELRLRTTKTATQTAIAPAPPGAAVRILALGDSITRGLDGEGGSWPKELERLLRERRVKAEVVNAGVAGLETFELARDLPAILERWQPAAAVTMIGNADITEPQRAWTRGFRVWRLWRLLEEHLWKNNASSTSDELSYSRSFGAVLRGERRYKEAIAAHLAVLKENPRHQMAHIELGQICKDTDKLELAEEYFRKAILLGKDAKDPLKRYSWANVLLLMLLEENGRFEEADQLAAKIAAEFPPSYTPYDFLAAYARTRGRGAEADGLLRAGVAAKPGNARLHLLLAKSLREQGAAEEAAQLAKRAAQLELSGPLAEVTRESYRQIAEGLSSRGIFHLAMQYPRREVAPLVELLGPAREGLAFVGCGPVFARAMTGKSYRDFFIDDFGGDFGHLTPEANTIVAGCVLEVLLPWLKERGLVH